jgi:D-beta-D-heptose 7-phosphate kinase / D-beta-D-heptose 1-phosphate adenosyltransferase
MLIEKAKEILEQFPNKKVMVLGDFYLDEYFHCTSNKFSPEAPVPRAVIQNIERVPGCAGNVAIALKSLGSQVKCFGVIGGDEKGRILQNKLLEKGVVTSGIITDPTRVTGVFSRILLGESREIKQHVVRFDLENKEKINPLTHQELIKKVKIELSQSDLLFIADYDEADGTGIITEDFMQQIIPIAKKHETKIVGITRRQAPIFKGVDVFICNTKEAAEMSHIQVMDDSTLNSAAQIIKDQLHTETLIITKAADGVIIFSKDEPISLPSFADNIVDVCGAGDTFSAGFALSSLTDISNEERGYIANYAAAVAASKPGTSPVFPEEIIDSIGNKNKSKSKVIHDQDELKTKLQKLKSEGKKIVFTNGYFDLLHSGHISFLDEARKLGDVLVVGLNTDRSTRENKGEGRPVTHEKDRMAIIAALGCVDYVTLFDELTPLKIISYLKPDILAKGGTYRHEEIVGKDIAESQGAIVKIINTNCKTNTEEMINKFIKIKREEDSFLQTKQ